MSYFDATISLGSVLTIVSIILSVGGAAWKAMQKINDMNQENMNRINQFHQANSQRLTSLETKMDAIWDWFTNRLERRQDNKGR